LFVGLRTDRAAQRLVLIHEAGQDIDLETGRATVRERHKHQFVATVRVANTLEIILISAFFLLNGSP
jgi:hypothetical protein